MAYKNEVPAVLEFLFGESIGRPATRAKLGPRALAWCRAFEDWLAHRQRTCHPDNYKASIRIWSRLLSRCGVVPWRVRAAHVQEYVDWLVSEGFAPGTVKHNLWAISSFYRWCSQERIDPGGGIGFNPVLAIVRPKVHKYAKTQALTPRQARKLLAVFREDRSILSLRDFALVLARLRMGVKNRALLELKWDQVDPARKASSQGGKIKRGEPLEIPPDVLEAILHYLHVSGRLEIIQDQDYIFAPLRDPLLVEASGAGEEWDGGKRLLNKTFNFILKKFGGLVRIPAGKLNLTALRHTATLLCLEAGDSLDEIQAFLGTRQRKAAGAYIHNLTASGAGLAEEEEPAGEEGTQAIPPMPLRGPKRFGPWETMTHGKYAREQPPEELEAILDEKIEGMDEEIAGLDALLLRIAGLESGDLSSQEVAALARANMHLAGRLSEMTTVAAELSKQRQEQEDKEVTRFLEEIDEIALEMGTVAEGEPLPSAQFRRECAAEERPPATLERPIATVRLWMRRAFDIAMTSGNPLEVARAVETYVTGCGRLVRLLKLAGKSLGGVDRMARIRESIDEAIRQVGKELDLSI